ncbi:type IX secretion system motor protein PorM/GldM [Brumimicrobium mesophilum]|uniref:type IX secretion system motor protein PorM/GldM n=1 Tax=Brumimicrobium mesophilum TaxID=392717 RepID=UPI000D142A70|nr:GldM family protein [Brumimicrobium mesophilum]
MAGGKETPRQKMIGMMYLVLTALLALNVSKEIIAAFVTINDKLESSGVIIDNATGNVYGTFESKRAAILTDPKADTKVIDLWQGKADTLNSHTKKIIHYILSESNDMITKVEGVDWVNKDKIDQDGNITELRPLMEIQAMDNYDVPTEMFIGGNPMKPKERGLAILTKMNEYRNSIAELMGNYISGSKVYTFTAPDDISGLADALKTANPEDTSRIANYYRSMTLPAMISVKDAGKSKDVPWPSAMFDHAPIVAAAAMFTALKLDVLNSESTAAEFMLSKVDAPTFNFNKIEALPFARTGYINAGDSLNLHVMIAAWDSTEVAPLKYGINELNPDNWKQTTGTIKLDSGSPGNYVVSGAIGVKEKGEINFKPWEFNYTVGKPSGTVSLPQMNVLYRGYSNQVEGAASGFPNYSLSNGGNVTLSKSAKGYIASPGAGREATINIAGVAEDGSSSNLGSFKFRVQDLPKPSISLGRITDGSSATSAQIRASRQLFAGYPPEIPLEAVFGVISWEVSVSGAPRPEKGTGSNLTGAALRIMANATSGNMITIVTNYREPSGKVKRQNAVYTVK